MTCKHTVFRCCGLTSELGWHCHNRHIHGHAVRRNLQPQTSGHRSDRGSSLLSCSSSDAAKSVLDYGTCAPETQSPVDVFPVTKMDRQVTPGNAGMVTIQNRSHKQTVIGRCSADMTFTTQKKIFYWLTLTCKSMVNHSRRLSLPVDAAYSAWNYRKNYGSPQNSNIEK